MEFDRASFVPPHEGDSIFPLSPFFSRLVRYAHRNPPRLAIRDVKLGVEKTYLQLLTDVLAFRKFLRSRLSRETLEDLRDGKEVYIALLAAGGYEYTVGFVAVIALGAAVVPMSIALPVQEASYFILKANCAAVITSAAATSLGQDLVNHVNKSANKNIPCLPVAPHFRPSPMAPEDIFLSTGRYLDDNSAAVVIFTSGTTGPPKGAVMKRAFLHDWAASVADHVRVTEKDVILHVLPVHHATGVGINFVPYIFSGACIEFCSGSVDIAWLWERWRRGGLDIFSGVPTIYMRMMRHFEQKLASLSQPEKDQYIAGARGLRALLCGTSALPSPVQDFWTSILGGGRITTRYGATEIGAIFNMPITGGDVPDGSVGPLFPGVTAKLSEGDEGEILVKSPYMFSKYLYDETATANSHNAEGFFKTGDLARREGKNYFILGRASIDILKSGGYKISALDIEREILGLPFIAEVMVVGVPDDEFGQRVAAVVNLRNDQNTYTYSDSVDRKMTKSLTINGLRQSLRSKLAGYKLPTLLRVIGEELPKSVTGKVVKKVLGPKYFPSDYHMDPEVQVWVSSKSKL